MLFDKNPLIDASVTGRAAMSGTIAGAALLRSIDSVTTGSER